LPDGSVKELQDGARPRDVVEGIGKRLADASIAAVVAGKVVDLDRPIEPEGDEPVPFRVLTSKDP
jgi:threonyl-tRNA synthetase